MQSNPAPRGVLFDAYGTLFDVYSVATLADQLFPGRGTAIAALWRDKQIEYTRLVTISDDGAHYRPFRELTRAALAFAIKKIAFDRDGARCAGTFESEIARLMECYGGLPAFPECGEVLRELKRRGVVTGILSNGDPTMLSASLAMDGLGPLFDHLLTVDDVRKYKTHPAAYAMGPRRLGCEAGEIAFVTSNGWDALAATWYGYRVLWVNRDGRPFEELGTQPERIAADLHAVLDFFPA